MRSLLQQLDRAGDVLVMGKIAGHTLPVPERRQLLDPIFAALRQVQVADQRDARPVFCAAGHVKAITARHF